MNLKSHFFKIQILIFSAIIYIGCSKNSILPKDPDSNTKPDTVAVNLPKYFKENTWIYAQMKSNYLWESEMPSEDKTDKSLDPEKYFKSLLILEKDWVSYMKLKKEDILDYWNGHLKSFGFRYTAYQIVGKPNEIGLAVSIVMIGSPAEKGGLWRGDLITKINGNIITESNLSSLLEPDNVEFTWINTDNEIKKKSISKVSFPINPIQNKFVFQDSTKKIGYLVYNQFLPNQEDNIRNTIGSFKNQNVNEFILDLRFNPGGFTPNAEIVGSLLAKNLKPNTEMYHNTWNKEQTSLLTKKGGPNVGVRLWTNEPNNLSNLNRLFVLTSKTTASSSELIVNSLKEHMEVILIGDHTFGKNVISTIITDTTGKLPYALMPSYTVIYNSKGESNYGTRNGFTPDFLVQDNILPYYPLGNFKDPLLRKAISIITGKPENSTIDNLHFKANLIDSYHHYDSGSAFDSK